MAPPAADTRHLAAAVARGEIEPIYCLSGERYLVDAAVAAIRAAVLARGRRRGRIQPDSFDLKESGIGAVLATAQHAADDGQAPAGHRQGDRRGQGGDLEPLAEYAEDPNPSTCLVLVGDKVDVRFKAFQALRKRGYLHEFAPLRDQALAGWLRAEAKARKIDIRPTPPRRWPTLAGPELGRLAQALEQLAIYVGRRAADRASTTSRTWSPRRASAASSS